MRQPLRYSTPFVLLFTLFCFDLTIAAQQNTHTLLSLSSVRPHDRINRPIDNRLTTRLTGNLHPLARQEYETGRAAAEQRMDRMLLVLAPDDTQKEALAAFVEEQQNPQSTYYHQWLTPEEFGLRFGASENDIHRVVEWLETQGFEVEPVAAGGRVIVFSGNVSQVESAFHTEIHTYRVRGQMHRANSTDPEIPEALAGVVHGIVSLHDFRRQYQHHLLSQATVSPEYSSGSVHYLSPADFSTIYDVSALYSASIDGTGQSIAVVGRTNIKLSDVATFRSMFGLAANVPTVLVNGTDPGIVSSDEQGEATLDVEWAGAVARKASVTLVVSASTSASDGVDLSAQYAVSHNVAPVVTVSFGSCESDMGTAENKFWNSLWQQAAAQGISVMVSSGDSGAAGCDSPSATTGTVKGVNGLCSSPYSTCVGGTQFGDTSNPTLYWGTSNSSTYGSALSYIPEAVWNESASGGLWATGGGASVVYSKPAWQTGTGVPADGQRDVPDVSLTAAGHDGYLIYLNSSTYLVAGTSAAAPSFAGLTALTAQKTGGRLGNLNPSLYTLATKQAGGGAAVFHDVTVGTNTVPGVTGFSAGTGYDKATGLGSVDAFVLANHWSDASVTSPAFQLTASPTSVSVAKGSTGTLTLTLTPTGGFTSAVALAATGLPSGVTASFSPASVSGSGSSTLTFTATAQAASGAYTATVTGTGGGLTQSVAIPITIPSACTYAITPASASATAAAGSYTVQVSTDSGCYWTAVSTASWISVSSGASGSGKASVSYSVAANTATSQRTGTLTVAGLTLSVTQAAGTSGYTLTPASASVGAVASTGVVAVAAPSTTSSWTAASNNDWLKITSGTSGTGSKSVSYSVAANTTSAARTGTLTIAGLSFTVAQAANACTYAINPTSATAAAAAASYTAQVTAPAGCAWTASSASSSWITVSSGASGTGNGTVAYAVAANPATTARSGALTIAGLNLAVTQAAGSYSLSAVSATFAAIASTGSVAVTAPSATSAWTAVSNATWITVAGSTSYTGSKTVTYSVAANTTSSSRTGSLTVAGLSFAVIQAAPCTYAITPATVSVAGAGGSYQAQVTAPAGCAWTSASNSSFITVTDGRSGAGNGTTSFTVASNTAAARSGSLTVAGINLTVTQASGAAGATAFSLSASSAKVASGAATGTVAVSSSSTTATWTAVSNASWIAITGGAASTGSKTVSYTVAANTTTASRTATLTIAGLTYTVTQSGLSCNYGVGAMAVTAQSSSLLVTFPVTATAGCGWTATSNAPWFTVASPVSSASGSGTATFNATVNNTGASRSATVTIAGYVFTLTQMK